MVENFGYTMGQGAGTLAEMAVSGKLTPPNLGDSHVGVPAVAVG